MSLLNFARRYRDLGLHPIPIEPKGKRPTIGSWKKYQEQAPTDEELTAWFTDDNQNMAVVLGRGILAVDLDGQGANDLLRKAGISLPMGAPISKTGNGNHVLLRVHEPIGDCVGLLSTNGGKPQVDIKGIGYIVVPPSVHENGNKYQWVIAPDGDIPQAPQDLLNLIKQRARPADLHGPGWVRLTLGGVKENLRDDTCTRLAGYFLGKNIDPETVKLILYGFAARCSPPMDDANVNKCVDSISKKRGVVGEEPRSLVPVHIKDVAAEFFESLDSKPVNPAPTSFAELDRMLSGGIHPGELVYMGARPGVGKTAMALQIATASARSGRSVLFVSREMTNVALLRRVIAQEGRINATKLRAHKKEQDILAKIHKSLGKLAELPIWMTDEVSSIQELATMIEGIKDLGLVIVDYLQMMRSAGAMKEKRIQIESVSQGLKALSLQYKLPVLCMSSLSRPADKKNPRPTVDSLRESGELEHDADIVLLLHREFGSDTAECIVAKNRDGHIGVVDLLFEPQYLKFSSIAEGDPQQEMRMSPQDLAANDKEAH